MYEYSPDSTDSSSSNPNPKEHDPSTFKYTDIDYNVFLDATDFVRQNKNPFDRHTYRYTPLLAYALSLHPHRLFGKVLFSLFDVLTGLLLCSETFGLQNKFYTILTCFYNPITINICTRGSAESLIVLFPVILTLYLITKSSTSSNPYLTISLAGLTHGLSVHTKIYPIIYTPAYLLTLSELPPTRLLPFLRSVGDFTILEKINVRKPLLFGAFSAFIFSTLTYISYVLSGPPSISQGLLYHFARLDHRHNYSPFFYTIYLLLDSKISSTFLSYISRFFLLPTSLIIVEISLISKDLPFTLFLITFIFVAFNKVITGQYFVWYLTLLPLISDSIKWSNLKPQLILLTMTILYWLWNAFRLEMKGRGAFLDVFLASEGFFIANCVLFRGICKNYTKRKTKTKTKKQ
ncbi:hypothetical protein TrVE_jg6223 [Triparma verrucosa]|uniref:GPI mannosyltransferase 1 n=1 Tax=Triparma verrucosa TaxID=1606542 RepID=A0A9W7BKJ2_9STRA|nr:hypothetical protein TrVE_jg6223 [Triparma verrucosa]